MYGWRDAWHIHTYLVSFSIDSLGRFVMPRPRRHQLVVEGGEKLQRRVHDRAKETKEGVEGPLHAC